jgi:hypothetical protein
MSIARPILNLPPELKFPCSSAALAVCLSQWQPSVEQKKSQEDIIWKVNILFTSDFVHKITTALWFF